MGTVLDRSLIATALLAFLTPAFSQGPCGQATTPCRVQAARQPYTAEFKITHVQTLANGTTITRVSSETQARDSQFRTMFSSTYAPVLADQPTVTNFSVHDPVDNSNIRWRSNSKTANVVRMPSGDQRTGCWAADSGMRMNFGGARAKMPTGAAQSALTTIPAGGISRPAAQDSKQEDLGTSSIVGVEVTGHRFTRTTPAGAIGNDAPIIHTDENWYAPSLGLQLRSVTDDPQTGKNTKEVVSLSLGEPDPSTFQPPEGYEVVTETMHEVPCQ